MQIPRFGARFDIYGSDLQTLNKVFGQLRKLEHEQSVAVVISTHPTSKDTYYRFKEVVPIPSLKTVRIMTDMDARDFKMVKPLLAAWEKDRPEWFRKYDAFMRNARRSGEFSRNQERELWDSFQANLPKMPEVVEPFFRPVPTRYSAETFLQKLEQKIPFSLKWARFENGYSDLPP